MTDQAFRDPSILVHAPALNRARQNAGARPGDKIVALLPATADGAPAAEGDKPAPMAKRDWASAVDLIKEASEAIRIGEERARDLEAQLAQVVDEASDQIRRLQHQVASGDQALARSEERVRAAEARAKEAEAWLARLHDAVFTAFQPLLPEMRANTQGSDEAPAAAAE